MTDHSDNLDYLERTVLVRDIGRLEGSLAILKSEVQRNSMITSEIKEDLDYIKDNISKAKGGLAVLIFIGSIVGAVISWVVQHLLRSG